MITLFTAAKFGVDHLENVSNQRQILNPTYSIMSKYKESIFCFYATAHYSTCGRPCLFLLAGMEVTAEVQIRKISQKEHTGTRVLGYFTWVLLVALRIAYGLEMLLYAHTSQGTRSF